VTLFDHATVAREYGVVEKLKTIQK